MPDIHPVDLDDFLEGEPPDFDGEVDTPLSREDASKRLFSLRRARAEKVRVQGVADDRRAQIKAWEVAEVERVDKRITWLETALRLYHQMELARDPKGAKTINLPDGELKSTATQPSWEYTDPAAFLAWCLENRPDLVRQPDPPPPEIDKQAVKAALVVQPPDPKAAPILGVDPKTQEVPPGLTVLPAGRNYKAVT